MAIFNLGYVTTQVALSYGRAAKFCKDAGYDGVEIHGAHGTVCDMRSNQ